jgi:hypothetical protein
MKKSIRFAASAAGFAVVASGLAFASAASAQTIKPGYEFKKPKAVQNPLDVFSDTNGASGPVFGASSGASVSIAFEGLSQYDVAGFARGFIPPDTMGAVGTKQFMEFVNGGVGVFDKATGNRTALVSDVAFWASVGQTGVNGDSRVLFNAKTNRWIALAFGSNAKDIQIAISDTDDALGTWKSTKFQGYAGFGFGATADYPTLAIDNNAVYIGTNNFAPKVAGGTNSFRGTTLNVIPISSLFGAGAPTTAGLKQFETIYDSTSSTNDFTRGFAIQGVNSTENSTTGNILAVSLADFKVSRYDVLNAGTAGAVRTAGVDVGNLGYFFNDAARQPGVGVPGGPGLRNIDASDDRIGSSVWEVNGRIYAVHTITPNGTDETRVRVYVIDSATNVVLEEKDIGSAGYDYYQGSIAVNTNGQVVIGYNRSGYGADGKVSVFARTFNTNGDGTLSQVGGEQLLKVSLTDRYLNGNPEATGLPNGRQRWGDYSAVTVDPLDGTKFWLIGQFAREANTGPLHPTGSGFSRWGTWISQISIYGVPEPDTWAMMVAGFGFVGASARRRKPHVNVTYA